MSKEMREMREINEDLFRGVPFGMGKDATRKPLKSKDNFSGNSHLLEQLVQTVLNSTEKDYNILEGNFGNSKNTILSSDSTKVTENQKERKFMDDSSKLLIERLERDSREREQRYHQDATEREKRYQTQLYDQDKKWREESKEREERILSAIGSSNTDLKEKLSDMKDDIKALKSDLNSELVSIKSDISANTKHVESLVRQNFWGNIATLVGILGVCATIAFTVWSALKG